MSAHQFDSVEDAGFSGVSAVAGASRVADSVSPRRSFLRRAATAAVAAAPALAVLSSRESQAAAGGVPSLYPGWNTRNFREIQNDEDHHVVFLITVITSLGGTPRPMPTFQNLSYPNPQAFVAAAQAFENTGVGAYQAAAPLIYNPGVLVGATDLGFTEAYHAGYLNTLANSPIVPKASPFSLPLMIPQIVSAVSPYLVSLNGGPDPSTEISAIPSPENDLAILNFALLLEYLEKTYYDINVPAIFH